LFIVNKETANALLSNDGGEQEYKVTVMAGPNHIITLPTVSTLPDGSSSGDPDGKISE
jgi:hypothetical protein